jgi:hypothetical protein
MVHFIAFLILSIFLVGADPRASAKCGTGSRACNAEEWQDWAGIAGVAAQRGGDVVVTMPPEDGDGEVA